ncbi:MATE family efflux transporter [Rhodovulum sp. DZ06]|uniref:MATE family efflux transporter n=1 Tax=Rhodovulum sp. DZ06 TaxID=3425126 RepID=UPI003D34F5E1
MSDSDLAGAAPTASPAPPPPPMAPEGRFTSGSIMRHVAVMTLSGAVGLTLMFLVDGVTLLYIAQLQDEALTAAVGFAWTIQFFIVSLGLAASIAATALVSRALGARDRQRAREAASAAYVITFLAIALLSAAAVALRYPILRALNAEGEALEAAARFLAISAPSMPLMGLAMIGGSIMRAEGDAKRAMLVTSASALVSVALDPLMIFDEIFGLPIGMGLGIDGAAGAMVFARAASCALGFWGVVKVHDLCARPSLCALRRNLGPIMAVAGPATLTQMSTPVSNYLLTDAVAAHGTDAMAGWSVTVRLSVLAFGGIFALSASVGGIFGQNYGAGQMERVRRTFRDGLLFCCLYICVAWAILALGADAAAGWFNLPPAGREVLLSFAWLGAGGFLFAGCIFVVNSAYNVLGRPIYASAVNWARDGAATWLWILALSAPFGAAGAVYAQGLAALTVGVVAVPLGWRFLKDLPPPHPVAAAPRRRFRLRRSAGSH